MLRARPAGGSNQRNRRGRKAKACTYFGKKEEVLSLFLEDITIYILKMQKNYKKGNRRNEFTKVVR